MYESPLKFDKRPDQGVIDLCERMAQEALDMAVSEQVSQLVGIRVDSVELRKALNYDRDMYNKGYQDGIQYAEHKPIEADWEPYGHEEEEYFWVGECGNCHENVFGENYCPNCGAKLIKPDREIWWKPEKKEEPKPEKPKPEGYGECWACRHGAWNDLEQEWECHSVCLCTGGQYWEDRKVNGDG